MKSEIEQLNKQIQAMTPLITGIQQEMAKSIVGQRHLIDRLLIGLLANGHVLLEGVPGLAKTATVSGRTGSLTTRHCKTNALPTPKKATRAMLCSPKRWTA